MERDPRMHHPHRCARSRRPQQVAEPTQRVKRCADHRPCQPAELCAAARRGRAAPGGGETTYLAGAPELLLLSQALQVARQLHAPDRHAVGQRPGMVSARDRRAGREPQARGQDAAARYRALRAGALAAIGSDDGGAQRRRVLSRLRLGDTASRLPETGGHPRAAHQHNGQDDDYGGYQ